MKKQFNQIWFEHKTKNKNKINAYCVQCKKNTENIHPKMFKINDRFHYDDYDDYYKY